MSGMNIATFGAVKKNQPRIIAHRGLSWDCPENTLSAFDAALAHRPDFIETDFHATKDGHLVCLHDAKLDRHLADQQPELRGKPIGELTLAQLKDVDMGLWKSPRWQGTRLCTLGEMLGHLIPATPDKKADATAPGRLLLEHKSGRPEQLLDLLTQLNSPRDRFVIMSFDWAFIRELRQLDPTITLMLLGGGEMTQAHLDTASELGAIGLNWNDHLTPEWLQKLHAQNLVGYVYTLNHPLGWLGAMAMGVDAVATDRCDKMAAVVRQ